MMPRSYDSGVKGGTAATWTSGEAISSIRFFLLGMLPTIYYSRYSNAQLLAPNPAFL